MPDTKYSELAKAIERNESLFRAYESDCRTFIGSLQSALAEYLGCSQEQVKWVRIAEEEARTLLVGVDVVEWTMDRRWIEEWC
jgi:hypothetical protein